MRVRIKDLEADWILFHQQGFLSTSYILSIVSCIMENTVEGHLVFELQYVVGGIQLISPHGKMDTASGPHEEGRIRIGGGKREDEFR